MKKFALWGKRFWGGFFHPRHPGVFLVLLDILLAILFTCTYVLLAIYHGALCHNQNYAYLTLFFANALLILLGLGVLHFLTLSPKNISLKRIIFLCIGHILVFSLGVFSIVLFHMTPTNSEMEEFIVDFFKDYERAPRLMVKLHRERACCGIDGIVDFLIGKPEAYVRLVPDSCCINWSDQCGDFRDPQTKNLTKNEVIQDPRFNKNGCFTQGKTFSDLPSLSPEVWQNLSFVRSCSIFHSILLFFLFVIQSYYICYRIPREDFDNDEDCPAWAKYIYPEPKPTASKINALSKFRKLHEFNGQKLQGLEMDSDETSVTYSERPFKDDEELREFQQSELFVGPGNIRRNTYLPKDQDPSTMGSLSSSVESVEAKDKVPPAGLLNDGETQRQHR